MTDAKSEPEASHPLQEILQNKVEFLESALQAQYKEEISLSRQLVEYNILLNDAFQVNYIYQVQIINLFEFFRIEFYRIYRIYRICRILFLLILKFLENCFW